MGRRDTRRPRREDPLGSETSGREAGFWTGSRMGSETGSEPRIEIEAEAVAGGVGPRVRDCDGAALEGRYAYCESGMMMGWNKME